MDDRVADSLQAPGGIQVHMDGRKSALSLVWETARTCLELGFVI